jgi:hypothetical protein
MGIAIIRIHRLTGKTEVFSQGSWRYTKEEQPKFLPNEELSEVHGKAGLSGEYEEFHAEIQNGSNWAITELTISITVKEKDGTIRWSRSFEVSTESCIESFKKGDVYIRNLIRCKDFGSFEWAIISGKGLNREPNKAKKTQ